MEGCSFIEMPSDTVKEVAQKCLAQIESGKRELLQKQIQRERQKYEKSLTRRLFRRPIPSDKEIEAILRSNIWFSMDIDLYGWRPGVLPRG